MVLPGYRKSRKFEKQTSIELCSLLLTANKLMKPAKVREVGEQIRW